MILNCLSSTGWSGEDQHGETDLLCPLGSRKAGSDWCLPLREAHPRCGSPSIWVSHIGKGKMAFQKLRNIFRVKQCKNISRKKSIGYVIQWTEKTKIETTQGWAHTVLLRQVNLDCSVEIWEEGTRSHRHSRLASTELPRVHIEELMQTV